MDGFDLVAPRLIRLRQDIDALFPTDDPQLREDILRLLSIAAREGLDLIPRLRNMLEHWPTYLPHSPPAPDDRREAIDNSRLEIGALPERRGATLWPYRPKRQSHELLSSWLWRIARGLGAPPRRFALDAIGVRLADVDREISDAAIERLAFWSGQSCEYLLRGTMRADIGARSNDKRERVQQALLRYGDLVLSRSRGGQGRAMPITQYCPVCLGSESRAYLRRGWRFSIEVVCSEDGCFLLDACWKCGALLDPLSQTFPSTEFLCCKCSAPLAKAPSLRMPEAVRGQAMFYDEIDRVAFGISGDFVGVLGQHTIETLSAGDLRGTNPANAAARYAAIMLGAWRTYYGWEITQPRQRGRPATRKSPVPPRRTAPSGTLSAPRASAASQGARSSI